MREVVRAIVTLPKIKYENSGRLYLPVPVNGNTSSKHAAVHGRIKLLSNLYQP